MADKDVGAGKEFPTDWHKETYIANLHRELAGAELRGDEAQVENVKAELARFEKRGPGRPSKAEAKEKSAA